MASISMLVSELAHSLKQPNNAALRENLKMIIIHTRNEIIRHSHEQHGFVDKVMSQRFVVSLQDVPDGEIELDIKFKPYYQFIKRTIQKVPRPVRLINNIPFDRVSSVGYLNSKVYPYIKETTARFRDAVPGLNNMICYDYINEYIYLFPNKCKDIDVNKICIEAAFEHPTEVQLLNNDVDSMDAMMDENEWLLSEDMIGQIKDIIYKRDLLSTVRETNEIPNTIKFNG